MGKLLRYTDQIVFPGSLMYVIALYGLVSKEDR